MAFFSNRRQPNEAEQSEAQSDDQDSHTKAVGFETVLGENSVFEGKFACIGNVRLNGHFSGTLEIDGNILVGESAVVHADIAANNISIAGSVHGHVTGNKVQILRTGIVWGDIRATALTTEEGAFIEGKITMQTQSSQPEEDEDELDKSPYLRVSQTPDETVTAPEVNDRDIKATVETGRIPTIEELDELDKEWQEKPPDKE